MDPQAQKAIEDSIATITAAIKALDRATDPATREALQKAIEKATAALRKLVADLIAAGEGPNARGVVAKALQQLGINVGKASASEAVAEIAGGAAATLGKLIGQMLSAIAIVLTSPSQISGIDRKLVSEFILQVGDTCFRLRWVKKKGSDELLWSPPELEWEEVPCEKPETVQP